MKELLAEIWTINVIVMRTQKEMMRAGEKAPIFLENTHKIMNKIVVEEGTLRIILMKSQMEMRNSFGKEGSKIGSVLLFFCLLGSRCLLDKRKDLLALGMLSLGLQGEVRGGNFQRSGPLKSG